MVRSWNIYGAPVYRARLSNGLTLITSKVNTPATAINISLKAGMNREEDKDCAGLAHFLEHMVFEGTSGKTQEKIAYMMDEHGGGYNAGTNTEGVEFTTTVVNSDLEEALALMAEMTFEADLTPRRVGTERNVVLQELREYRDDVEDVVTETFFRDALKKHPAKYPVQGRACTVKNIKRSHLRDFYEQYFVPNNIVLVLVGGGVSGGVNGRTRDMVERYFGRRRAQPIPDFPITREPVTTVGTERMLRKHGMESAYVTLGVVLQDKKGAIHFNHQDTAVANVIENLLSGGEHSRLFWLVRKRGGHCYGIESDYNPFVDLGVFTVSFNTAKSRMKKVLDIVYKEIEKLKTICVSEEELEREKRSIAKAFLMSGQDLAERAEDFATYEMFSRYGVGDLSRCIEDLNAVTPERIRDFARRFFDLDKFFLAASVP
ncbi:insulinase family protein [Candidatus Woesearchaeota archaeon]|nr:insulinase family protein [Candidatus Woesearchaeota archaeon]